MTHTYTTTITIDGQTAIATCEAKQNGAGWTILPAVAIDSSGTDISERIDFKTDCAIHDGVTKLLYDLYPSLRAYDPYFGMQSA